MRKYWLSFIVIVLVGLIISVGLIWRPWVDKAEALAREDVEKAVLEQYSGEILNNKLLGDRYNMQLKTETGIYELKVDSFNGEIISLKLLNKTNVEVSDRNLSEKNEVPQKPKESKGDNPAKEDEPPKDYVEVKPSGEKSIPQESKSVQDEKVPVVLKQEEKTSNKEIPKDKTSPVTKTTPEEKTKILTTDQVVVIATNQVNGLVDEIELRDSGNVAYYLVEIEADDRKEAVVQVNAISGAVMSVIWDDKHDDEKDSKEEDDDVDKLKKDDDD